MAAKYKDHFNAQKSARKEHESISVSVDIMFGLESGAGRKPAPCYLITFTATFSD